MQKGNIGVTTENIFPIIKKFLYSDHEIFLRELVSNAVDATQKLKTYASKGDFKGEMGDLTVKASSTYAQMRTMVCYLISTFSILTLNIRKCSASADS